MPKKKKILGAIAGVVGVAVIATGVYFAVPAITDKTWGEIFHLDKPSEVIPAEKCKLTLNTNGNLTFICADDKGNTYTEEELEQKEWQGETLTFTLAPNNGYMLWSVKVNDEEITLENNMFTLTMNEDKTIDVDVQELREYTANIIEDRYCEWQLAVNGEPLNTGDTIRTGDLISGRVISLTSGWKISTFLVNDNEYVQVLDTHGFIQEPIRVSNTDLSTITFVEDTARDFSSIYVPFDRNVENWRSIITHPTYSYTSEICSVYRIINDGIRIGEEVKMDFTILDKELFGGITLNGEALEVTVAEDGVTASCTFIVPENEVVLEVVSSFEPYNITFNYDETKVLVDFLGGDPVGDDNKTFTVVDSNANLSFVVNDVDLAPNSIVNIDCDDGTSYSFTVDELPAMDLAITSACRVIDITILEQSESEETPIFINLDYDPLLFSVTMNPLTGNCTFDNEFVVTSYSSSYSFELTIEVLDPAYFEVNLFEIRNGFDELIATSTDLVDGKLTITVDQTYGEYLQIRVIVDAER